MKSVIVDIDGTIANNTHRLKFISGKSPDWYAFAEEMLKDLPIQPTIDVVKSLSKADYFIILVTGRAGNRRDDTTLWLSLHGVPWDVLLMREPDNHETDVELKRRWLHMLRDGRMTFHDVFTPKLAMEDRLRVVEMWRAEGLIVHHVDTGNF